MQALHQCPLKPRARGFCTSWFLLRSNTVWTSRVILKPINSVSINWALHLGRGAAPTWHTATARISQSQRLAQWMDHLLIQAHLPLQLFGPRWVNQKQLVITSSANYCQVLLFALELSLPQLFGVFGAHWSTPHWALLPWGQPSPKEGAGVWFSR